MMLLEVVVVIYIFHHFNHYTFTEFNKNNNEEERRSGTTGTGVSQNRDRRQPNLAELVLDELKESHCDYLNHYMSVTSIYISKESVKQHYGDSHTQKIGNSKRKLQVSNVREVQSKFRTCKLLQLSPPQVYSPSPRIALYAGRNETHEYPSSTQTQFI